MFLNRDSGTVRNAWVLSLIIGVAIVGGASSASAGVGRTFVASNGQDGNTATNCAVTAPCQTFAAAYGVTNDGGEIIAIDAAGYGPLTITSSVRIVAMHRGFIKPAASASGITISAGSGKVTLENIEINGANGASTTGVTLNSGHLILKNVILTQLTTGLSVASSKADVIDSEISYNTTGVSTTGSGVDPNNPTNGGTTQVRISAGSVVSNGTAFFMNSPGTVNASSANLVTILIRVHDNSSGAIPTDIVGNTTVTSGSGGSCATNGNCQSAVTYPVGVNFNAN